MIVIEEGLASSEDGSHTELIPVVVTDSDDVFEVKSAISFDSLLVCSTVCAFKPT